MVASTCRHQMFFSYISSQHLNIIITHIIFKLPEEGKKERDTVHNTIGNIY